MQSYVLENGHLLLNDGSGKILKGAIRVENGRISKIGKSISEKKGEKRYDLSGQLLIPGFVQTHVHLCQTLFRNLADDLELLDWLKFRIWPFEGAHTEKSLYASARLGIAELLAGGTTTILDMGTVHHTDAIFEAAKEMGIRAFIGKCLMDRDGSPKELRETTDQALKENLQLIERWHGRENGRLLYAQAPRFVLSCTENLLQEVKKTALDKKLLIHTHSSENKTEVESVRKLFGCENIEALDKMGLTGPHLVLAHCIWLNEKEKKILARTQTRVSHCPSSNLKLASGICSVPELKKMGINVSLGADGAPCNNNLNMFQEMRLASLIQKPLHGPTAMGAREVFEMATIEGARALGLEKEIGSIEMGKKADLTAIDFQQVNTAMELNDKKPAQAYSALVYACSPQNITQTWVDGKSVYRAGSITGARLSDIVTQAKIEQKKLLARVKTNQ